MKKTTTTTNNATTNNATVNNATVNNGKATTNNVNKVIEPLNLINYNYEKLTNWGDIVDNGLIKDSLYTNLKARSIDDMVYCPITTKTLIVVNYLDTIVYKETKDNYTKAENNYNKVVDRMKELDELMNKRVPMVRTDKELVEYVKLSEKLPKVTKRYNETKKKYDTWNEYAEKNAYVRKETRKWYKSAFENQKDNKSNDYNMMLLVTNYVMGIVHEDLNFKNLVTLAKKFGYFLEQESYLENSTNKEWSKDTVDAFNNFIKEVQSNLTMQYRITNAMESKVFKTRTINFKHDEKIRLATMLSRVTFTEGVKPNTTNSIVTLSFIDDNDASQDLFHALIMKYQNNCLVGFKKSNNEKYDK